MVIGVLYLVVHVYITALWHLASVVSVLEPVYGLVAMKKSYELLKGKIRVAVGALVIVNLVGLLVQSVLYYVCKSYHHQGIDKTALHEHLGGYLGEYVPLKSSLQMENLEA
ncbi:hypothetical protein OIU84_001239 [Salix udensis]|uniref:Uncharacterized protein n=1 Tax=Salix udensis TaxID=889485 RepID=A0AAD6K6K8_9ROSI|nr:hypothetical protein OIU84_001239 [Salix udensis]